MRLWPRKQVYVDNLPKTHDLRFAALFVVLFAFLLGSVYTVGFVVAGNRLPSGTTIAGVDVGGMKRAEARSELQDKLIPRLEAPIKAAALGETFVIHPQRAGLTFDLEATLSAGLEGDRWDPRHMLHVVMGGDAIPPVIDVDGGELDVALAKIAKQIEQPAVEAAASFKGGVPTFTAGQEGVALDYDASEDRLVDALVTGDEEITLPVKAVDPQVSTDEASKFITDVATPAVTGPVRIRVADTLLTLRPALFAQTLRAQVDHGDLALAINQRTLLARSRNLLGTLPHKPVNAQIVFSNGHPAIVPSRAGVTVASKDWATAVLRAAAHQGDKRRAVAKATPDEPEFTTGDARLLEVTSRTTSSDLGLPRSLDLDAVRAIASRLDGALIRPGATFSFLKRAGVSDADAASAVASAAYAAAFNAGMSGFVRSPARVLTPGAAPGLDAEVAPDIDLQWHNGTPYGVYIRAYVVSRGHGPSSVHVDFWSRRYWTVTTTTTPRYNPVEPTVQRVRGPDCQPRDGRVGFEVDVQRTLTRHGLNPRMETYHSSYQSTDRIVCVRRGRR